MKRNTLLIGVLALLCHFSLFAQEANKTEKIFSTVIEIPTTSVKNQQSTGTCWCFATTSFIETELMRLGAPELDLSEMFTVRLAYSQKAQRYFRLHGNGNYSEGGQAHDVLNVVKEFGFVPESIYSGNRYGSSYHIHSEMVNSTKAMLDEIVKNPNKKISSVWLESVNSVLDTYMGEIPESFDFDGERYTPLKFVEKFGFNPDDYVELTSYDYLPLYQLVDLEIPDNWSEDLYYNVPIDELMEVINHALNNGFSVCWDGDVSEKGFSHRSGYAMLPMVDSKEMTNAEIDKWEKKSGDVMNEKSVNNVASEPIVDQQLRQESFDNFETTDDHLMHLTGIVKDEDGKIFYKTKNSWAANSNEFGGYLNMSESYVRLKTVAIMLHKDAIPKNIKNKLGL